MTRSTFKRPAFRSATFDKALLERVGRDVAVRTLSSASELGHAFWDQTAPIGTDERTSGDLRRGWYSHIRNSPNRVSLIVGVKGVRYAIYVELGTSKMAPRAPIRTVGGEITAIIGDLLREELRG